MQSELKNSAPLKAEQEAAISENTVLKEQLEKLREQLEKLKAENAKLKADASAKDSAKLLVILMS